MYKIVRWLPIILNFTRSQEGQQILENHGFTSVHSARGLDLIERFGVKRCVIIVRHLQPVELKVILVYLGKQAPKNLTFGVVFVQFIFLFIMGNGCTDAYSMPIYCSVCKRESCSIITCWGRITTVLFMRGGLSCRLWSSSLDACFL